MDYYREFEAEDDAHNYVRSLHGYLTIIVRYSKVLDKWIVNAF